MSNLLNPYGAVKHLFYFILGWPLDVHFSASAVILCIALLAPPEPAVGDVLAIRGPFYKAKDLAHSAAALTGFLS
jgi:hypothetical protein